MTLYTGGKLLWPLLQNVFLIHIPYLEKKSRVQNFISSLQNRLLLWGEGGNCCSGTEVLMPRLRCSCQDWGAHAEIEVLSCSSIWAWPPKVKICLQLGDIYRKYNLQKNGGGAGWGNHENSLSDGLKHSAPAHPRSLASSRSPGSACHPSESGVQIAPTLSQEEE